MSQPRFVAELRSLSSEARHVVEREGRSLESSANQGDLKRDFLQLQLDQAKILKSQPLHSHPKDQDKNRYKDVIPYEHARVILDDDTYINASEIRDVPGRRSGTTGTMAPSTSSSPSPPLPPPPPYIACQGPLSNTSEVFWDMVVERGVSDIIMLTGLVENGRDKCHNYFADGSRFGKYRIRCVEHASVGGVDVRELDLETGTGRHRVRHHQLMTWPDHGVPASPEVLDSLLDVMYDGTKAGRTTLVHCSAGIGRSGVLIALAMLLERVRGALVRGQSGQSGQIQVGRKGKNEGGEDCLCSFVDIVGGMRRQRAGMVQTAAQYGFCVEAGRRLLSMLL